MTFSLLDFFSILPASVIDHLTLLIPQLSGVFDLKVNGLEMGQFLDTQNHESD